MSTSRKIYHCDTESCNWQVECKRLKGALDDALRNITLLDSKLEKAGYLLNVEKKRVIELENEKNDMASVLEEVCHILCNDSRCKLPEETKNRMSRITWTTEFKKNSDLSRYPTVKQDESATYLKSVDQSAKNTESRCNLSHQSDNVDNEKECVETESVETEPIASHVELQPTHESTKQIQSNQILEDSIDQDTCFKKNKALQVKIRWTEKQKSLTKKYFKANIKNGKPLTKSDIEIFRNKNSSIMQNKDWRKIKAFVSNEYTKRKQQMQSGEMNNCLKKRKTPIVRTRWTDQQKRLTKTYFKANIENKKYPTESEIEVFRNMNIAIMGNKDWKKIKMFIYNEYTK